MALPTVEILERAELLAARLNGGPAPVKKNVLLGLISDFMNEPEPDVRRLRRLLEMIEQGSGGHIRRGAGYGDQLRAAVREIRKVLDKGGLDGKDYKSLFGWTARLLLVRSTPRDTRPQLKEREGGRPSRPETRRSTPDRSERFTPQPPSTRLGGVNTKGMSALEKLRKQMEDQEKGGQGS
jgi:hypothetical protein